MGSKYFYRSRDKDRSPKDRNRDREGRERRSKSRERRRRRSHSRDRRSKDRERSKRQHRDDERQYDEERQYEKEREKKREKELEEAREKEMERERLREIAMELKAAQFAVLAEVQPPMPLMQMQPMFVPEPPKPELSQAFLEAVAASQRIAASKNFAEIFNCTNSNDSTSNGPTPLEEPFNATGNNSKDSHANFSVLNY